MEENSPVQGCVRVATWLCNSVVMPRVSSPCPGLDLVDKRICRIIHCVVTPSLRREPSVLKCSLQDWLSPVREAGQGMSTSVEIC